MTISIFVIPTIGWRYLLIIIAIPTAIFFVMCFVSTALLKLIVCECEICLN